MKLSTEMLSSAGIRQSKRVECFKQRLERGAMRVFRIVALPVGCFNLPQVNQDRRRLGRTTITRWFFTQKIGIISYEPISKPPRVEGCGRAWGDPAMKNTFYMFHHRFGDAGKHTPSDAAG